MNVFRLMSSVRSEGVSGGVLLCLLVGFMTMGAKWSLLPFWVERGSSTCGKGAVCSRPGTVQAWVLVHFSWVYDLGCQMAIVFRTGLGAAAAPVARVLLAAPQRCRPGRVSIAFFEVGDA